MHIDSVGDLVDTLLYNLISACGTAESVQAGLGRQLTEWVGNSCKLSLARVRKQVKIFFCACICMYVAVLHGSNLHNTQS